MTLARGARGRPTTPDEYLRELPAGDRAALEALRAIVRSVSPELDERMSSGAPFVWYRGRRAVGYGAARGHLSFYIMHGAVLRTHAVELAGHDVSRTVVRFTRDRPLPAALVRRLVEARLREIAVGG